MFKLLIKIKVDEAFALDAREIHLIDTGVRITGPGERLFKEEAERRDIRYKPFLLEELVSAISSQYVEGTNVPQRIASQLTPFTVESILEASFIYPTSRTSWASCVVVTPGYDEEGNFMNNIDVPAMYRILRYSDGFTEYEIKHTTDTEYEPDATYIVSGEGLADDLLRARPLIDASGAESFDYIRLTETVVR